MYQYALAPVQPTWQPIHISESCTADTGEHARADWACAQPIAPVQLTGIQRAIYDYIRWHQRMWGETPLYREIAAYCGLKSKSAVQYQIRQLINRGLIRKPRALVRVIRLTHIPVKVD